MGDGSRKIVSQMRGHRSKGIGGIATEAAMRLGVNRPKSRSLNKAGVGALLAAALAAGPGVAAQEKAGPTESLEARLRALEARVTALESRGTAGAPAAAAVQCRRLSINGSNIVPGAT